MKHNKLIPFLIIFLLAAVVIYFVVNNSRVEVLEEQIENGIKNSKIHNASINNLKKESNLDKPEIVANPYLQLNEDSEKWADVERACGYSDFELNNNIEKYINSRFNNKGELSKSQMEAKNRLIEQCNDWYDYLNSLSSEQLKLLKGNIKDIFELTTYFFNDYEPYDEKMLVEAKEYINQGGDSSGVTQSVLAHLLQQDLSFKKVIAHYLGTQDLGYITNNAYRISLLYGCEVEPNECSADSMMMSSRCIDNPKVCGRSYVEHQATKLSQNHFADLMNIVGIIRELVNQGYFDLTKSL